MKRFHLALLVTLGMGLSYTATAATIVGAKVGIQYMGSEGTTDGISSSGHSNTTAYFSFEHPIPLVPNIKLSYTDANMGRSSFNQTNVALYYEILDNGLVSLDVGAALQQFSSGHYRNKMGIDYHFDDTVPSAYLAGAVGIPATDLSFFSELTYSPQSDATKTDFTIGANYSLANLLLIDLNLKAGYRTMDYNFKDVNYSGAKSDPLNSINESAHIRNNGWFLGAEFDF